MECFLLHKSYFTIETHTCASSVRLQTRNNFWMQDLVSIMYSLGTKWSRDIQLYQMCWGDATGDVNYRLTHNFTPVGNNAR